MSSSPPELEPKHKAPSIKKLRFDVARWLSIPPEDEVLVDVLLGVFKSHEIPGDPLWLMIIDGSGGGKTELLRSLRAQPSAYFLSKLTEKSLVSGFRGGRKDPSLLPKLNGKILIVKDLAPILSLRRESRNDIFGQLRDAYDGFLDSATGNIGTQRYESRFTFITACTQAIEHQDTMQQELGERFIRFRCRGDGRKAKTAKAIGNLGSDGDMRQQMIRLLGDFLARLPAIENKVIPPQLHQRLVDLADFTAKCRSHVARDRAGTLQYMPRPEYGTRLGKELGKLLLALGAVRGKPEPDDEDFAVIQRIAEDCLPSNRLAVVQALSSGPKHMVEVEKLTGLPHKTVDRILDDLRVLGAAQKVKEEEAENSAWKLRK